MTAAQVGTGPFSLTVSPGGTPNQLTLLNSSLDTIPAGTVNVVASDGVHVWWALNQNSGTQGFITIGNAPQVGPSVADLTTLSQQVFNGYTAPAGNPLITSGTPGGPSMSVDIGNITTVNLADSGAGVWTGAYTVPDLGFAVSGVGLFGHAYLNNQASTNDAYKSPELINIDAQRPDISTISITSSGYGNAKGTNGLMYLSSLSMGNSSFNPANTIARFDYNVNKENCIVSIQVDSSSVRQISPPPLGQSTSGTGFWTGTDGAGNYVFDNVYTVEFGITDANGVQGVTKTAQITVTSLILEIKNVSVAPSNVPSNPNPTGQLISTVSFEAHLRNESGTSIRNALANLGWGFTLAGPGSGFNDPTYFRTKVYGIMEIEILNSDGTTFASITPRDLDTNYDDDITFLAENACDPRFQLARCYASVVTSTAYSICGINPIPPGVGTVDIGDADRGNDWNIAFDDGCLFKPISGSLVNPNEMVATQAINWTGAKPPAGNYRVRVRSTLTGQEYRNIGDPPTSPNTPDCGSTSPVYIGQAVHFFPTARPEFKTDSRGRGYYVEDASQLFSVNNNPNPTSDNTPPAIFSVSPANAQTVLPNVYGKTLSITAVVQDPDSPISVDPMYSFITLSYKTLTGQNTLVQGRSTTDGGSPTNGGTIFFFPNTPLSVGGQYTLVVNTCDIYGNCASYTSTFSIQDTATPLISFPGVQVLTATNPVPFSIYPQTAPVGPLDSLSQIWLTLAMPSSSANTVDWADSGLALVQEPGDIPVIMSRITVGTPTDATIRYQLPNAVYGNFTYKALVTAVSQDNSGNKYVLQQTSANSPGFFIQLPNNLLQVFQGSNVVLSMYRPLTITTSSYPSGLDYIGNPLQVVSGFTPPALSGFTPIGLPLRFNAGNTMTFNSSVTTSATTMSVYYNGGNDGFSGDLPQGVSPSALVVKGYTYGSGTWTDYPPTSKVIGIPNQNHFDYSVANNVPIPDVVAIFFSNSIAAIVSPTAQTTPVVFNNTRSFNPNSSNPLHNQAKIYYGTAPAQDLQAKVFNMAGALVRTLSVGNGISLSTFDPDPSGGRRYFFTWDGTNDGKSTVKNGIYLIWYKLTDASGAVTTVSQAVALLK